MCSQGNKFLANNCKWRYSFPQNSLNCGSSNCWVLRGRSERNELYNHQVPSWFALPSRQVYLKFKIPVLMPQRAAECSLIGCNCGPNEHHQRPSQGMPLVERAGERRLLRDCCGCSATISKLKCNTKARNWGWGWGCWLMAFYGLLRVCRRNCTETDNELSLGHYDRPTRPERSIENTNCCKPVEVHLAGAGAAAAVHLGSIIAYSIRVNCPMYLSSINYETPCTLYST